MAAFYYFSARPDFRVPIKIAGLSFTIGLLVFALSIGTYVWGLIMVTTFAEKYAPELDRRSCLRRH